MPTATDAVSPVLATPRARTSTVLLEAVCSHPGERITLGELVERLGDRTYGLLLLVLALPNTVPMPGLPGLSTVFGAAMLLLAVQMAAGSPRPWIPRWLRQRSFSRTGLEAMLRRALPYLQRLERALKPRWAPVTRPVSERIMGVVFSLLALAIALPIPFGNWLPAVTLTVAALGLAERDGLVLAASALMALAVLGLMSAALAAAFVAVT